MSTDTFYCSRTHITLHYQYLVFFFLAGPPLAFKGTAVAGTVLLLAAGGALLVAGSLLLVADVVQLVAGGAIVRC